MRGYDGSETPETERTTSQSTASEERLRARVDDLTAELASAQRQARNYRSAYERARSEALVYRRERDTHLRRVGELSEEGANVERRLGQAVKAQARTRDELAKVRRRLQRSRRRVQALENSRAVRLSRAVRRVLDRLRPVRPADPTPTLARPETSVPARVAPLPAASTRPVRAVVVAGGQRDESSDERATVAERSAAILAGRLGQEPRRLRVAAVVDDFTRQSLACECDLIDLRPSSWRAEIEAGDPDILFVESAWRGVDGTWHNTVPRLVTELQEILQYCRTAGIPTVFWNKEDPVHFQTFLRTAREFDRVYTTDLDCIPKYRAALGHARVHFLPFACQPRLQHPIQSAPRKDALGFAGGYYARYPERMRDLQQILRGAAQVLPVEIWDRAYGTTLADYQFPAEYEPLIQGTLGLDELDVAYKGYRFALNLNSVKHSQSMFARRAYELLSCGTVTISNYAHGLRVMLGDLVPMSDSAKGTQETLERLGADTDAYDRLRLAGMRKVHSEHTYADRLRYLVATVTGNPYELRPRRVTALLEVDGTDAALRGLDVVTGQLGVEVAAVFVTADLAATELLTRTGQRVLSPDALARVSAADLIDGTDGIAVLHRDDWYGPTYLLDLVLAREYTEAAAIGKGSAARFAEGRLVAGDRRAAYRSCLALEPRSALLVRAEAGVAAADLLTRSGALAGLDQFSVDRFDYCRDGAAASADVLAPLLGTIEGDTGSSTTDLFAMLEQAAKNYQPDPDRPVVDPQLFVEWCATADLAVERVGHGVRIRSTLEPDAIELRWLQPRTSVAACWPDGIVQAYLECDGDLDVMFALRFYDAQGAVIASFTEPRGNLVEFPVPDGSAEVAFALRIKGPGAVTVHALGLQRPTEEPLLVPTTTPVLLVADHYPSYDNLYRNGFVHTRVRAYRARGLKLDVFRTRSGKLADYHEFDGVEVATGSFETLQRRIAESGYTTIVVHFLSERLWEALAPFRETHRIVIWVHGAEVQPWWRRSYNATTGEELVRARELSDARVAFWQRVLDDLPARTSFVFVSRYFAEEVQTDLERRIPEAQLQVIHNPVDTALFGYEPKGIEQRTRILSIRPYASRKYANDLAVAAVLRLAEEPWFDRLEFCFVGDGPLFEETVAPLRGFDNVVLRREFLTQPEIAALHRDYGVFLVPTRMDAQGVSRDEAMSSGLVPVTTAVAAVPEFVSPDEGYLAPPEDVEALAAGIAELYHCPEVFERKSRAAAERARRQVCVEVAVPAEVALIQGEDR